MKVQAFLIFIIILGLGFFQLYNQFKFELTGVDWYKEKTKSLQAQLKQEELKREIQTYEMYEFQQEVATLIPESSKQLPKDQHKAYELRRLASIVTSPKSEKIELDLSRDLFEKGRELFRAKDYAKSIEVMKKIINDYPISARLLEAHFLLAESYYLHDDFSSCLDVIDTMLTQFPDSDLTGFILLRMGQIYEIKGRKSDAAEIYQTVIKSYANADLKKQAQSMLEALKK